MEDDGTVFGCACQCDLLYEYGLRQEKASSACLGEFAAPVLSCPVLDVEAVDPAKLALIIRNQYKFAAHGLRSDKRIERANGCASAFELCPDLSIRCGVAGGKFQDRERAKEILHQAHRLRRLTTFGGASP